MRDLFEMKRREWKLALSNAIEERGIDALVIVLDELYDVLHDFSRYSVEDSDSEDLKKIANVVLDAKSKIDKIWHG